MMPSFKALINYRNQPVTDQDKALTVFIRATMHRNSIYLNTNLQVTLKHWSGKERLWVKPSHHSAIELNAIIQTKITELERFVIEQNAFKNPVSLDSIKNFFNRRDKVSFNAYVEQYLNSVRGLAGATISINTTAVKYLEEFAPRATFSMINEKFLRGFANYLSVEANEDGLAGTTVHKYFKRLKGPITQAVADGYIFRNPLDTFSLSKMGIKDERVKPRIFLNAKQVATLRELKLSPKKDAELIEARRRWLFCFYVGIYYNDLLILKWENVKKCDEGFYIDAKRYKNSQVYISPIYKFKNALEILDEQRAGNFNKSEFIFYADMREDHYLKYLKVLADKCGFDDLLGKSARHSFAQFWSDLGLPDQFLQIMMGHEKVETTQVYKTSGIVRVNEQMKNFSASKFNF